MERVELNDGLSLSRIVYGLWRLADDSDTSVTHVQSKIEACLEQGITTLDEADIYGNYESERLLGKTLKAAPALREKIEIVTKCGIKLNTDKFPARRVKYYDTTADYIKSSVDNSLQLMNIERVDLLLIHRPDPLMNASETGAALDALVASGKVRSVGVSNFKPHDWTLLQNSMQTLLQTNQIEISLLANEAFTNGDIAWHQQQGIIPMAWSPLSGGDLMTSMESQTVKLRQRLEAIATEQSVTADAVAIAWLLNHPVKILPVLGTNNLSRIKSMKNILTVKLDREAWYELYELANGQEVP